MWTLVRFNKTGQLLWLSDQATYNNKLCTFIKYVRTKYEME